MVEQLTEAEGARFNQFLAMLAGYFTDDHDGTPILIRVEHDGRDEAAIAMCYTSPDGGAFIEPMALLFSDSLMLKTKRPDGAGG